MIESYVSFNVDLFDKVRTQIKWNMHSMTHTINIPHEQPKWNISKYYYTIKGNKSILKYETFKKKWLF
jgi:hypothetical protein